MDNEIEDLVGDVKYTDSQKSVATSNMYSMDFTDSSSDKNNSSGKETYVIEWDESDDSEKYFNLHENQSVINLNNKATTPITVNYNVNIERETINKSTSASFHKCAIAQEIFTQTSKTIIELAEKEGLKKTIESRTLQTQTSLLSIAENKKIEYRIQVSGAQTTFVRYDDLYAEGNDPFHVACNGVHNYNEMPLDDESSKRLHDRKSECSFDDNVAINIANESNGDGENKEETSYENNSLFDQTSKSDTDIEEDSLMCNEYNDNRNYKADSTSDTSEVPKSVDDDIENLYKKLSEKNNFYLNAERSCEPITSRFNTLTTLTEEPLKNENVLDITPLGDGIVDTKEDDKYVLFVIDSGIKVKVLPDNENTKVKEDKDIFKLPPLKSNQSCPTSPHFNFKYSVNQQAGNKNSFLEGEQKNCPLDDRWEIANKDLAAGESPLISGRSDQLAKRLFEPIQLPPIHADGNIKNIVGKVITNEFNKISNVTVKNDLHNKHLESINIKDKIGELKMNNNLKYWPQFRYSNSTTESRTSRSPSPDTPSLEDSRLGDVAERGCEALCSELLKRLKSTSWFEVSDTLLELPKVMDKFWGVIHETRIADLIRQVSCHVDSPRTQVARYACNTLASILKNTNYTKKPDFYEAVTILLVKTGSFSRPVRRAANVALDAIVSGVELPHAVTALCIHGTSHKNPLVRCAAARLLVVSCALAAGGRELLRTRPPSAVCARRHALRSLAALLEDKNVETRKYAERLYSMLRPLTNFEAFYLTDLEVEVATRQMKKYDQLLLCGPPKEHR
ncbi:unnamed protein product [Diatraea saccharalis]|uniref:TOG domain-containing protein n=1 Tax=Diatraea saccharalis TaxID=40085 RepID=A0A9N9WDG5_9NEOP|nr:unnamed protein product [Diatraea saccharalis]